MRITAIQSEVEFVLCHGATRDVGKSSGPLDLTFIGDNAEPQIAPLLRGARALVFDRGNDVDVWTFGILHREASNAAAHQWLFEHRASLPRNVEGTAPVRVEFRAGNVVATMDGAVVLLKEAAVRGVVATAKYKIVGARTTLTPIGG